MKAKPTMGTTTPTFKRLWRLVFKDDQNRRNTSWIGCDSDLALAAIRTSTFLTLTEVDPETGAAIPSPNSSLRSDPTDTERHLALRRAADAALVFWDNYLAAVAHPDLHTPHCSAATQAACVSAWHDLNAGMAELKRQAIADRAAE